MHPRHERLARLDREIAALDAQLESLLAERDAQPWLTAGDIVAVHYPAGLETNRVPDGAHGVVMQPGRTDQWQVHFGAHGADWVSTMHLELVEAVEDRLARFQ